MPPGQSRYEVQLSSKSGPIDVFLIQEPTSNSNHHASNNLNHLSTTSASTKTGNKNTTHFHASEMLKQFDIPMDAFTFEMKADEGAVDLYGSGSVDVYSVFDDRRI